MATSRISISAPASFHPARRPAALRRCWPSVASFHRRIIAWILVASLFDHYIAAANADPKVDLYGDPLPQGALARLGTIRFHHPWQLHAITFSRDGSRIISCGSDDTARVWDANTGTEVDRIPTQRVASGVAVTPKGLITFGDPYGHLSFYSLDEKKVIREVPGASAEPGTGIFYTRLCFNRAGDRIIRFWSDGATVIDLEGRILRKLTGCRSYSAGNDLALVWDSKELVYRLVNAMTGQEAVPAGGRIPTPSGRYCGAQISDDGRKLVIWSGRSEEATTSFGLSARYDWAVEIYDTLSGRKLGHTTIQLDDNYYSLAITGGGRYLLVTDYFGTRVFDLAALPDFKQVGQFSRLVQFGYSPSPDGKTLAFATDSMIRRVDTAT